MIMHTLVLVLDYPRWVLSFQKACCSLKRVLHFITLLGLFGAYIHHVCIPLAGMLKLIIVNKLYNTDIGFFLWKKE